MISAYRNRSLSLTSSCFLLISIPIKISFVNRVERERQKKKKKESTSLSISGVTHAHVVGRRGRWAHTHLFEFPAYLSVWAARRGSPFKGTCLLSPLISRFKGNQFIIRHLFIITLIDLGKNVSRRQNTGFRFAFTIYGPGFKVDWLHLKCLYMSPCNCSRFFKWSMLR